MNKYGLKISELAISDLNEIWVYIAQDSPKAADRSINNLYDTCYKLTTQPRTGRLREELLPGVRSITYKKYIIFYRIRKLDIEIIRILHGARDLRAAL